MTKRPIVDDDVATSTATAATINDDDDDEDGNGDGDVGFFDPDRSGGDDNDGR